MKLDLWIVIEKVLREIKKIIDFVSKICILGSIILKIVSLYFNI